jgi:hypothetical protein
MARGLSLGHKLPYCKELAVERFALGAKSCARAMSGMADALRAPARVGPIFILVGVISAFDMLRRLQQEDTSHV